MRNALIAAAVSAVVAAGSAGAAVNHIQGHGGPQIPLSEACTRLVIAAPGEPVNAQLNVDGQQIKCLIRRPDPFARCVRHLPSPKLPVAKFDHGEGKPGDWTNVDSLYRFAAGVQGCAHAHLSRVVPQ